MLERSCARRCCTQTAAAQYVTSASDVQPGIAWTRTGGPCTSRDVRVVSVGSPRAQKKLYKPDIEVEPRHRVYVSWAGLRQWDILRYTSEAHCALPLRRTTSVKRSTLVTIHKGDLWLKRVRWITLRQHKVPQVLHEHIRFTFYCNQGHIHRPHHCRDLFHRSLSPTCENDALHRYTYFGDFAEAAHT